MAGNVLHEASWSQADAYTVERFRADSLRQYMSGGIVRPTWVQVRKRRVTFCGRVEHTTFTLDGTGLFLVDCQLGQLWFAAENVRRCSGDGRCTCEAPEGVTGGACDAAAPAGAVPLGNTGTTREAGQ